MLANMKYLITLLVLASLMSPASAQPPVTVPDQPVTQIDDLGYFQPGYQLRNGPEVYLPVGETYGMDSPTGAACQQASAQKGKEAWLLHCPWRGPTGVSFEDFRFALPASHKILLTGDIALMTQAVGKSDGATFRIFVDGDKRLDINRKDDTWQPFSIDLTPLAGKTVDVRFETDPGPRNDPSFDFSIWGDRTLTIQGLASSLQHSLPGPDFDLRRLRSVQNGSVAPLSAFAGARTTAIAGGKAFFIYSGPDGVLKYTWTPTVSTDSPLGTITLDAHQTGGGTHAIPLAGATQIHWTAAATLISSKLTRSQNGALLTCNYSVGGTPAVLVIAARMVGKSLVFDIDCNKPVIADIEGGPWGPVMVRRTIDIPYYSNSVLFLPRENLFAGAFLDWTRSGASSIEGLSATYGPKTDGARNPLRERLVYTAAWSLDETLPNIPNPPSPYRALLGRGVILDTWGGAFSDIQDKLHMLTDAGIGPATAIIHDWQHFGYDNGLPQTFPPNAGLGGDAGMKALVESAQSEGIRVALHENYVDYYPNYPYFSDSDIAKASDGSRIHAWFNPDTKIQSFAVKPTRILALAHQWSPLVEQHYHPEACYLDVHSAVPPWFHVDFDSTQPGAASFQTVRAAHTALWAYERRLHHGPVLGEGLNHWYWSGLLDGVEAQFGVGWPQNMGTTAPLLVDFDLLKIHPLQLNHGMGYYNRWSPGDFDSDLLNQLDTYRMQEIAFGHEGFLTSPYFSNTALALEEDRLLPIVTSRTATASVTAIDYENGGRWRNVSDTIRFGGDFSRVRVRYDDGITIWGNSSTQPLHIGTYTLPPSGWLARGDSIVAGTVERSGRLVDLAESPDSIYVNARPSSWRAAASGVIPVAPSVEAFQATGPRSFTIAYRWHVASKIDGNYTAFVHFTDPQTGAIIFQQDHQTATPTQQWKPGIDVSDGPWEVTVPANIPAGDYNWTIGLYNGSGRLSLEGRQDSQGRILLGTLHLGAGRVGFTPAKPSAQSRLSRQSDIDITLGPVRTNGCVDIRRVGKDWVLRPIACARGLQVALDPKFFGAPSKVETASGPVAVARSGTVWILPVNGSAVYRWRTP